MGTRGWKVGCLGFLVSPVVLCDIRYVVVGYVEIIVVCIVVMRDDGRVGGCSFDDVSVGC
jgi:hypothetical protein